jgi:hypothetical protein
MWKPRRSKPSSIPTTRVASGASVNPRGYQLGHLTVQRFGMLALPGHDDDEVSSRADRTVRLSQNRT